MLQSVGRLMIPCSFGCMPTSSTRRLSLFQMLFLITCIVSSSLFLFQVTVWNHEETMWNMTKFGFLTGQLQAQEQHRQQPPSPPISHHGEKILFKTDDQPEEESVPFKKLSTLNCDRYLTTDPDSSISSSSPLWTQSVQDIVYWYDIPSDAKYINPFQKLVQRQQRQNPNHDTEKYFLFEHDSAGFNNLRMSFENSILLGISTGRTIVLPPKQPISMFRETKQHTHRFAMNEIYDFDHIQVEFGKAGIHVLTMTEFLEQVVMKGKLLDQKNQKVVFPPGNKTRWEEGGDPDTLKEWLRDTIYSEPWDASDHFVFWPNEGHILNNSNMEYSLNLTKRSEYYDDFVDDPVPVNGTIIDRLSEFRSGGGRSRDHVAIYKGQMEQQKVILFKTGLYEGGRLLSPFYTFHFFEDWRQDLWSKRFVRDHLRYNDEIMCAAARIVADIKHKIRERRGLSMDLKDEIEFHTSKYYSHYCSDSTLPLDDIGRSSHIDGHEFTFGSINNSAHSSGRFQSCI